MRPRPVFVVDIIGEIVDRVNTQLIAQLQAIDSTIQKINYLYGAPLEINETLTQMSQAGQYGKYPLVALYQPFDEGKGGLTGIDGTDNLRIVIARGALPTDKAADRYTKNFKPILYPIYAELLYQLAIDNRIATTTWETIKHRKRDWPYWSTGSGRDGKNPLVDYVDIIEISNLELNFRLKNCQP